MLFRPLRVIADKFNVLQMGMVAAERVFIVLDNQDQLEDADEAEDISINGNIVFHHVGFAYQPGISVLKDVSFSIREGQTLAIVGHTGSGKSTIINLINRMYQHQEGIISIDGIPIEKFSLQSLRSQIAVVLQDVFLFSGSIEENVTLRNSTISHEKVVEAAKLIGIHDFIESLPGGYAYNVQERGATLSTGQRQLLSFLRALLFNPSILILDEATSSVDSNTETLIQNAIEVLTKGRTSIVIAHRLSTIRKAHKIIVLDQGKLIEEGTHQELIASGGAYAKMIEAQLHKDGD
ncbi:MAG: ABC transporter ATP-binding protein [Chitinophagaceae bacterium]